MDHHFRLDILRNYYSSLLDYLCSNKDFLKSCSNVTNIWKTTDQNFLRLMGSFFSKQPDDANQLIPSSKLYSAIVSFSEKNNDQELLNWVKSFNKLFLSAVANSLKKNKIEEFSSFTFNEQLRICSDMFHQLKLKNESLENLVLELQTTNETLQNLVSETKNELKLSQNKNLMLTASLENFADEECDNFRKRMRSKICSINADHFTTI